MKEISTKTLKYFLYIVTAVQFVPAVIWTVIKAGMHEVSIPGIITTVIALIVFSFLFFEKKSVMWVVFVYLLTLPCILQAGSSGHLAGLPEAPAGSFKELCAQRFSWPYICDMGFLDDYTYPEEMDRLSLMTSPSTMWNLFFGEYREKLCESDYDILLNRIIETGLSSNKTDIGIRGIKDTLQYLFTPVTICMNMAGYPGYLAGRNMTAFRNGTGNLGRVYFSFSAVSFLILFVLGILNIFINRPGISFKSVLAGAFVVLFISLYNIFFTVRGFNYLNSSWIVMLWTVVALWPLGSENAHS